MQEIDLTKNNLIAKNNSNLIEETKNKLNDVDLNFNPNYVWGKLVSNLREKRLMTLHTACGEIRNFESNGKTLTIFVKEEYLYNILTKVENLANIKKQLSEIQAGIELKVDLVKKQTLKIEENLKRLKQLFGEDLIVK